MRGLLVAGTTSDAGKSVLTAGLCRWLDRQGVTVAPFKAQNMSNNSMVTADGAEIGRAQWVQAVAARVEPEAAMNPVLLKPASDHVSHVVINGRPAGTISGADFLSGRAKLAEAAFEALDDLERRFDVVVCEGAGSPAEINLRDGDFVNMGLARHAKLPVIVVGDIDRGGVFAALHGTVALLSKEDQALVAGFLINKFRGEATLLRPALDAVRVTTGRPVLGTVPWLPDVWLDSEDTLNVGDSPVDGDDALQVVAVRFPRISNFTDLDPLAAEPGVSVRYTASAAEVMAADLVVLPGSRATVADLDWLRRRGIDRTLTERHSRGRPTIGICGGYQMLAREIVDEVESDAGSVAGLGLLPATVRFEHEKVLGRPVGEAYGSTIRTAYAIHHGRVRADEGAAPFLDGCRSGAVWGTSWHGIFEEDEFRRAFLRDVAERAGRHAFVPAPAMNFAELRDRRLDRLADAVEEHIDTAAVRTLIDRGPPGGLPFVPPGPVGKP